MDWNYCQSPERWEKLLILHAKVWIYIYKSESHYMVEGKNVESLLATLSSCIYGKAKSNLKNSGK